MLLKNCKSAEILADLSHETKVSFRSSVTAARRSLEASGLGSNPRGGAGKNSGGRWLS